MADHLNGVGTFAFMKFVVKDLDRMAAFYGAAVGLGSATRIETGELTELVLRNPAGDRGLCLVLCRYADGRDNTPGGAYGALGIYVPDVDAAHARALGAGAGELRPPFDVRGLRVSFVQDPEGREIEFLAPLKASA
ncbi:VOC family protein [Phenylobacterium sp.]|jgi:predicted enzyme related to lactoylglutathione lyase|uniref:VOC family protein n=1 Tax=Phenylobacterium sp. TaxID=1871053 RepID=UPI002F42D065